MSSLGPRLAAFVVIIIIIGATLFYAVSDYHAPSSARGIVSANVIELAPRVAGEVTQVHVVDDAMVKTGDPLFSIDPYPFELALKQAEANLETALQNVNASSANIVAAQSAVTQARVNHDNAKTEMERISRLEQKGLVSASQADNARASEADALARLDTAKANLASAKAALGPIGEDNPAVAAASAALARAQYDLASTTVSAPHDGVVTNMILAPGQFISAGRPSLTFIDTDTTWITLDLRENQLQFVEPGDRVNILFDAVPGTIFEGKVLSVAWGIDTGRTTQKGLVVNKVENRWFEPARRIPIRISLDEQAHEWPQAVRVGGKVHAVVYAKAEDDIYADIASWLQMLRSYISYLH